MTELTPEGQINNFTFEGSSQLVSFVETMHVVDGVECDVYTFDGDDTKDLGIIRMKPGARTPLQRVREGDKTIESYISGKGKLTITKPDGSKTIHEVQEPGDEDKKPLSVEVQIGELMQWEADPESNLSFSEICFPPYEDGRYENLPEE